MLKKIFYGIIFKIILRGDYFMRIKEKCLEMVVIVILIFLIAMVMNLYAASTKSHKEVLDTQAKKCSYAAGYDFGVNFLKRYDSIDLKSLIMGLEDAIKNNEPLMDENERLEALKVLGEEMKKKLESELKMLSEVNKEKGRKFLEENAKKEGVITTASGLQYKIIKEGSGLQPTMNDKIIVHYKGRLLNGTVFDDTFTKDKPAEFFMERLIPGWKEALQMMKEGSRWELYLKPELAYGEKGYGAAIGPYETVIFEIELIKVIKLQ